MNPIKPQRRGRRVAMTPAEIDAFLTGERTCRVATVSAAGRPHVAPLWFVWAGSSLWLYSIVDSQRWADLMRRPEVAIVVDAGIEYGELRGVEITGTAGVVGDVPRSERPDAELTEPEQLFAEKYFGGAGFAADGRHAWLRITPEKITSWDFRKL